MPPKRKRAAEKEKVSTEEKTTTSTSTRGRKTTKNEDTSTNVKTNSSNRVQKEVVNSESSDSEEIVQKPAKKVKNTKKSESKVVKETKKTKAASGDNEDNKPKAVKNQTSTTYTDIDFGCSKRSNSNKEWNFKVSNWNVDGIRAWIKKGGLEYIDYEKPDVFCIQETKCSENKIPPEAKEVEGYSAYWHCSSKEGYAGVGLYSKTEPISVNYGLGVEEHDTEGRMITAEYDKFYVISVYVPNAGRGLVTLPKRLDWNDAFRKYVKDLDEKKPVIICGDMNVAHLEIDLANPKTNTKNAGFTKEERDGMTDFLSDGYIDTFRKLYPVKTQAYTFWTYMSNCRAKNVGWRLDYFIVSERMMDSVCDNVIRTQVFGSDHCPIALFLSV